MWTLVVIMVFFGTGVSTIKVEGFSTERYCNQEKEKLWHSVTAMESQAEFMFIPKCIQVK